LTEAAGDYTAAAALYRPLLKDYISLNTLAQAGLARCEQFIAQSNDGEYR
jgi:hypothetical protein